MEAVRDSHALIQSMPATACRRLPAWCGSQCAARMVAGLGPPGRRAGPHGTLMAISAPGDTSPTLIERVQTSPADREAWEEFVRRYQPMIRAWCVKWGLQASDADDVT